MAYPVLAVIFLAYAYGSPEKEVVQSFEMKNQA